MVTRKLFTLVFLQKENQILLGLKKRGFGMNKWNGFGGKVEINESIVDAAIRELYEESCVKVNKNNLKNIGHLEFTFEGETSIMDVHVYSANRYEGTPTETEEMSPRWFNINEIPYDYMWPDDKIWFPYMLNSKLFNGSFQYKGFDTILNYTITELDSMESFYLNRQNL